MSWHRWLALCLGDGEQITVRLHNSVCCKTQLLCLVVGFPPALGSTWVGDTQRLVESYIAGKRKGKLEYDLPDIII